MEKQNPLSYGLLNGSAAAAEEPRNCFFTNPTSWDLNPMDQNDPFESALSSMVSSPATSSGGGGGGENIVLRELIGRLGSICSSGGEISPHSYNNFAGNSSTNTSCYNTPLNSPPKLNLSIMDRQIRGNLPISGSHSHLAAASANPSLIAPFTSDPGFAERAARYSCFGKKNLGCLNGQIGLNDAEFGHRLMPKLDASGRKISTRASSNQIPGSQMETVQDKENTEIGDSMEISSLTEQITRNENINDESNPRKRKSSSKGKAKEPTSLNSSKDANLQVASENTDTNAKRSKSEEGTAEEKDGTKIKAEVNGTDKNAAGDGNKKQSKDELPEPPKDYIHVRARRGQATDAHSLAERVRREKISERMKLLQNLVPGCNKVTGKAVMLDEIINYVQSLQHQVEFLSMKLATVNPRSDLNVEAHLSKDVISPQGLLHHNLYHQSDASATEFPHQFYTPQGPSMQSVMPNGIEVMYAMNHLSASSGRNTSIQMPSSDNFGEVPSEVPAFWGDDLHSLVQMGLGQNQTQNIDGIMSTAQMKVEQ